MSHLENQVTWLTRKLKDLESKERSNTTKNQSEVNISTLEIQIKNMIEEILSHSNP